MIPIINPIQDLSNTQGMKRLRSTENQEDNTSFDSNILHCNVDIIGLIYCTMESTVHKNNFSLVSKTWMCISNEQTKEITLIKPWAKCSAEAKLSLNDSSLISLSNRFKKFSNLNLNYNNTITDCGIADLTKLTYLNLNENHLITNSGISNLTNLTHLNLGHNLMITNSGIEILTKLTQLNLFENTKISYAGISNLTNLKELNLKMWIFSGQQLIKDADVANLTQLSHLNISGNKLITNSGISNLTNLLHLDCSGNDITEEGVKNLTKLISLDAKFTITNDFIRNFTSLKKLTLKSGDLVNNDGVKYLTQLTDLTLCNKLITDLGISHLTNLTKLDVEKTSCSVTWLGIRKLNNLRNLNSLKEKYGTEFLSKCRIESFNCYHNGRFNESLRSALELAFEDFPSKMNDLDRFTLELSRSKR